MMRVFGCRAMSLIPGTKRGKLDEKSIRCIYLRHATDAKAYRLYNTMTKSIFTSCNVKFFEDDMSANVSSSSDSGSHFYFEIPIEEGTVRNDEILDDNEDVQSLDDDSGENDNSIGDMNSLVESTSGEMKHNESISSEEFVDTRTTDDSLSDMNDEDLLDNTEVDPTYKTRAKINNDVRVTTRSKMREPIQPYPMHGDFAFIMNEPQTYKQAIECEDKEMWLVGFSKLK